MHRVRCDPVDRCIGSDAIRCIGSDAVFFCTKKISHDKTGAYGTIHVGNNIGASYPRRIGQVLNDVSCILDSMLSSLMGLPNRAWVAGANVVSHMAHHFSPFPKSLQSFCV